jgi:addiction module HigA family antidote
MYDPPHPGEIIREDCMVPLGLSVTAAAERLGVSRTSLSELLNGRVGVSPKMAVRLGKAGVELGRGVACSAGRLRSVARAGGSGKKHPLKLTDPVCGALD